MNQRTLTTWMIRNGCNIDAVMPENGGKSNAIKAWSAFKVELLGGSEAEKRNAAGCASATLLVKKSYDPSGRAAARDHSVPREDSTLHQRADTAVKRGGAVRAEAGVQG